jgi:hypothetical protein
LLSAEGFADEFISSCVKGIQKNTERTLNLEKLNNFCACQRELIKTKKLTDAEVETLSNPNSILFYEVMYKCGDPFDDKKSYDLSWNEKAVHDISGPASDTINVLTLNGMTYVKVKTGSMIQFWLFDTGASDLLISKDMEADLKKEGVITASNYLGVGEYEMANGDVDTCRKYRIDNIRIGKFTVNNIVVAVTEKGKRIIVGKGLLNKFTTWILNNKENSLILNK